MNKEQKRKLRDISLLALVGLIGGTFAFQAFNQQAINDRLRDNGVEVGGRVHDYYNRDTENKDVFVENFGQEEIMARIRLSEFMEIQRRGQTTFEPVVDDTSRDDVTSWTTWKPEADDINDRQDTDFSNAFDEFSNLTLGWERDEQFAPWYLPTFNLIEDDERTAAAGHARDYIAGGGATDGITDGATHPGDGTDGDWSEGESYDNSSGDWFGSQVTRETAQNLAQERPPMTMDQWVNLDNRHKVGDFWVVDQNTGWAYWASKLQVGETTSYLLDAAEMTEQADAINGSYYYGIHVESNLVSPDHREDFEATETGLTHHERLAEFLEAIDNGAMDDDWGNPPADENVQPDELNFSVMNPGRIFTMANEQFQYLEDMGEGNHMIMRSVSLGSSINFFNVNGVISSWYDDLETTVQDIVQPVSIPSNLSAVAQNDIIFDNSGGVNWLPTNLSSFPDVYEDVTEVSQAGVSRAFALSLADVTKLSQPEGAFSHNHERRAHGSGAWSWWLRTPGNIEQTQAWSISVFASPTTEPQGALVTRAIEGVGTGLGGIVAAGVRPALIVNNTTNE